MLYAISWGELDSMMRTLIGRLHLERHATKIVVVSQKGTAFRPFKLRTSLPEGRRQPRNDSNQNVWFRHTTVAGAACGALHYITLTLTLTLTLILNININIYITLHLHYITLTLTLHYITFTLHYIAINITLHYIRYINYMHMHIHMTIP